MDKETQKYAHLITPGVEQPLQQVLFHHAAPVTRHVLGTHGPLTQDGGVRMVTHLINTDLPATVEPYCDMHVHPFDEMNLLLSETQSLVYEFCLGDEVYTVQAPASVYIPAGLSHAANVKSGRGIYVAMLYDGGNYRAEKG